MTLDNVLPKSLLEEVKNTLETQYITIENNRFYYKGKRITITQSPLEYWVLSWASTKIPGLQISKHIFYEPNEPSVEKTLEQMYSRIFKTFIKNQNPRTHRL